MNEHDERDLAGRRVKSSPTPTGVLADQVGRGVEDLQSLSPDQLKGAEAFQKAKRILKAVALFGENHFFEVWIQEARESGVNSSEISTLEEQYLKKSQEAALAHAERAVNAPISRTWEMPYTIDRGDEFEVWINVAERLGADPEKIDALRAIDRKNAPIHALTQAEWYLEALEIHHPWENFEIVINEAEQLGADRTITGEYRKTYLERARSVVIDEAKSYLSQIQEDTEINLNKYVAFKERIKKAKELGADRGEIEKLENDYAQIAPQKIDTYLRDTMNAGSDMIRYVLETAKELGVNTESLSRLEQIYPEKSLESALDKAKKSLEGIATMSNSPISYDTNYNHVMFIWFEEAIQDLRRLRVNPVEITELELIYAEVAPMAMLKYASLNLDLWIKGAPLLDRYSCEKPWDNVTNYIKKAKELGADRGEIEKLENMYAENAPSVLIQGAMYCLSYLATNRNFSSSQPGEMQRYFKFIVRFEENIKKVKELGADPKKVKELESQYSTYVLRMARRYLWELTNYPERTYLFWDLIRRIEQAKELGADPKEVKELEDEFYAWIDSQEQQIDSKI